MNHLSNDSTIHSMANTLGWLYYWPCVCLTLYICPYDRYPFDSWLKNKNKNKNKLYFISVLK